MKDEIEKLKQLLSESSQIVLLSHTRPDGDAVASLGALGLGLKSVGHDVFTLLPGGVPDRYSFLPGLELISANIPDHPDLIIALDSADLKRLAIGLEKLPGIVDVNIDHHVSNSFFGKINIVDTTAAATTQILYRVLNALEIPLSVEIATNLLTGLVTDTIGFRTENVSAEVLALAADLQKLGASLSKIIHHALDQKTYTALRYWGCGLTRLEKKNGVVWTTLKLTDRDKVGYQGLDDADLINMMSSIQDTYISVILIEQPKGRVKVSWRAKGDLNVSRIAETFGGGGHKAAAGAMVEGNLEEVKNSVLTTTFGMMNVNLENGV